MGCSLLKAMWCRCLSSPRRQPGVGPPHIPSVCCHLQDPPFKVPQAAERYSNERKWQLLKDIKLASHKASTCVMTSSGHL